MTALSREDSLAAPNERRPARPAMLRLGMALGLALLVAALLWHVGHLAAYARAILPYPYQMDFGEGIVWQQMRDMVAGTAYAPLGVYPAIVYHYPPVYHLASAATAGLFGLDELLAGRLVSLVATVATAILSGLLAIRAMPGKADARIYAVSAVLAGLLFLNCYPVIIWGPLMRVDMLAGALALAGMVVALRAIDRPALVHGAALLFTLSVFTKQNALAAPIASFAVLLLIAPRTALRGIASGMAMALAALGLLMALTDGRFLTHVVAYNVNRIDTSILANVLLPQLQVHGALILVAGTGAIACARDLRGHGLRARPAPAMLLIFVAVKTVMLLGMMKSGSNYNYMIEWFSGLTALAAIGLRPAYRAVLGLPLSPVAAMSAAVMTGLLALQTLTMRVDLPGRDQALEVTARHRPLIARIAASPRPVISDDMAFLIRAGRKVEFESAITAELGAAGLWDQPAFVAMVRARCFGFFVTDGDAGEFMFDRRYNPPVAAAIAAAYPRIAHSGKFVIHLPADASSDCRVQR